MSRILIIDDALMMRNILKRMLLTEGYEICGEASNGVMGVRKYNELKPDLVLCDIMMEDGDGITCLKEIIKSDPDAKVVMCTSQGQDWFIKEATEEGALGYITKPFETASVLEKLKGILSSEKCKDIFEKRSSEAGLSQREILDFEAAFHVTTEMEMDAPEVTKAFIAKNMASIEIGLRAFLPVKMSLDSMEKLIAIFREIGLS